MAKKCSNKSSDVYFNGSIMTREQTLDTFISLCKECKEKEPTLKPTTDLDIKRKVLNRANNKCECTSDMCHLDF